MIATLALLLALRVPYRVSFARVSTGDLQPSARGAKTVLRRFREFRP